MSVLYLRLIMSSHSEDGHQNEVDELLYPTMMLKSIEDVGNMPDVAVDLHTNSLELESRLHHGIACQNDSKQEQQLQSKYHISPSAIPGAPQRLYLIKRLIQNEFDLQTLRNISSLQGDRGKAAHHPSCSQVDKLTW
jgi:hypothetical protein